MDQRKFTNVEIAKLLKNVSAAYEVKKGNKFKILAYNRAANAVEHSNIELIDLWEQKKLIDFPGIGPNIAGYLDEYFRTGKVKHFEKIFRRLPKAMFKLMEIPGIGPKNAYKLCKKLNIKDESSAFIAIKKAALDGKIRQIEGFGEKSEKELIKSLEEIGRQEKRYLLPKAQLVAEQVIRFLSKNPYALRIEPLGSLRRKNSTVGDIDIAVATDRPREIIQHFINYPLKKRVIDSGEDKASILLINQIQIDLRVQPLNSFGSLLQHLTGSKEHNIALREYSLKKGFSLSEYGIKKIKKTKVKIEKYQKEEQFYNALGLDWIPPELRENTGEIEAAANHKLPNLVKLDDIKGDLHIHSDFPIETSHDNGASSLEEIILKAINLGYEYIALSEHNPSIYNHKISNLITLFINKKRYIEQILSKYKKMSKNFIVKKIFNSLEVDILPNGALAVPDEALKYLDFAIASIHSSFRMDKQSATKRIISGLKHPKVKILGHPTSRKLLKRDGVNADWDTIFKFCYENKKILEVNSWPDRLDLPDVLIRQAINQGVKLIINTDSHQVEDMELMRFGVWTARRGWAQKKDILNCLSYDKIKKWLFN